jgi:exoribonuclease-2
MTISFGIGELIVFKKKDKPVLGIVSSVSDDSLVVVTEDGKEKDIEEQEIDLKTDIIADVNNDGSERILILRQYRRDLNQSRETIDLESLWDSVAGSVEKLPFEDILDIYAGDKEISKDDALKLYWALNKSDIYFDTENSFYFPTSESDVKAKLVQKEHEKKKSEETSLAVVWARNFIEPGNKNIVNNNFDIQYFIQLIKDFIINKASQDKIREAKSFLNQLGLNRPEEATNFLIKIGECSPYSDPNLIRLEYFNQLSKKTENEIEKVLEKEFNSEDFVDLRSLEIITIDDSDTEDIDDAISLERNGNNLELGIHISNVSYYIDKGSSIDQDASKKGDTVYIPDTRIDIFPKELINKNFSLFEFLQSVINVSRNYSYEEAQTTLLKEKKGKELVNIALSLRQKRINKGAFLLQLPELKFSLDDKGRVAKKINRMNSIPHMIIAELMILTNNLTAKYLNEHNLPSIFRVQKDEVPQEARDYDINDPLFSIRVVKHLRPSVISTNPGKHKSLGLDGYVQSTSPIRRYSDVVVQRQIIGIIGGNEWIYDGKELFDIISRIVHGFGERRLLQKNRKKYWLYRYFQENIEENISGIVSEVNEPNLSVYLPDYFVEIPIKNYTAGKVKEYDVVTLNVDEVDPLRKKLKLKIVSVN